MKKFKKLSIALSLVLCMSTLFWGNVFAQESNKETITKNTIITEENICDVLKYLNIDANNFIKQDQEKSSKITTVKDLSNIINQVRKINKNININNDNNNVTLYGVVDPGEGGGGGTGSIYLQRDVSPSNDYSLTYSCWAEYQNGLWKRATSGNIEVGNDMFPLGVSYNISRTYYNRLSVESLVKIKYDFKVDIEAWTQVAGVGIIKIGAHTVTSNGYFYTGDYILL